MQRGSRRAAEQHGSRFVGRYPFRLLYCDEHAVKPFQMPGKDSRGRRLEDGAGELQFDYPIPMQAELGQDLVGLLAV